MKKNILFSLLACLFLLCSYQTACAEKWTDKTEKITIANDDLLLLGDSEDLSGSDPINKTVKYETVIDASVLRGTNVLTENVIPVATSDGQTVKDSSFLVETPTGDDKGIAIQGGQLSVGVPGTGQEFVVGEGDSAPVIGAWHCEIANTTNQTVTDCVDVTAILQSDTGSTTGLFGGTDAGDYLLVYSDTFTYGGVKAKIDTAGIVEPANILGEYLSTTNTWTNSPFMATDSTTLEQFANVLAARDDSSEQWRFGFNPLGDIPPVWASLTMNINGTDYTGYFARLRITNAITSDPLIEQIKLHTNRFEVNSNGRSEYFGIARYPKTILIQKSGNADKNPPNENISVAVGITQIANDNEFTGTANDGLILSGVIPEGMDTSVPVQLIIDWYPTNDSTGDVELELELVAAGEGFVFDGTTVPAAATPIITSLDTNQEELQRNIFLVDNTSAMPGDTIYGSLFRDSTAGNTDDTYSGNIIITNWQVIGYFYKP